MNGIPGDLASCMDLVREVCSHFRTELAAVPITHAHAEAQGLLAKLESMIPEVMDSHANVQQLFRESRESTNQHVAEASQYLDRAKAVRDGLVSDAEITALQKELLGMDAVVASVPEPPQGWSQVLEDELLNRGRPLSTVPANNLGSNAWNDWNLNPV